MSKWIDYQDKEARDWERDQRREKELLMYCGGCGVEWSDHVGPEATCRRLQDVMQAVIDWHLGEPLANARLRDIAEDEIKRRTGV